MKKSNHVKLFEEYDFIEDDEDDYKIDNIQDEELDEDNIKGHLPLNIGNFELTSDNYDEYFEGYSGGGDQEKVTEYYLTQLRVLDNI